MSSDIIRTSSPCDRGKNVCCALVTVNENLVSGPDTNAIIWMGGTTSRVTGTKGKRERMMLPDTDSRSSLVSHTPLFVWTVQCHTHFKIRLINNATSWKGADIRGAVTTSGVTA